jgi:hypothetical protein
MRKFAAAFVVAIAIAGTTAVAAQADDPPIDTTSPFVQCSPDVCSFTLVPPPVFRIDGMFDGD